MPDRDVKMIRDLIYYQYAKIIARRAFGGNTRTKLRG
jgi:archaeosine-15-forming tRNA-guanine transglycosylase